MSTLPLRLQIRPLEPSHGLLLRLGSRNGYSSTRRFAASLGLDYRQVLTGHHAAALASLGGIEAGEVSRCSPIMLPGRKVGLLGEVLDLGDWSSRDRRYCPACFGFDREAALSGGVHPAWYLSHRTIWDVRSVQACPAHGIRLLNSCYRCGHCLGWGSTDLSRCEVCQADLLGAPCDGLDDDIGAYVAGRLLDQAVGNQVLDPLPLWPALRLCERLGQIEAVGAVDTLPRQTSEMLLRAQAEGFAMTCELALAVTSAFDTVIRLDDRPDGLIGAYGWIYGEWLSLSDLANYSIRALMFTHAVRNGVISADEPVLGNVPRPTITMTQAARELGMGHKRARALVTEAGIVPPGSRRSVSFTIDPEAVVQLAAHQPNSMTAKAAGRRLNIGKTQVADLLAEGLLLRGSCGGVEPSSIDRLLGGLGKQCCVGSKPAGIGSVSTASRNASIPLWRIVRAMLEGEVPCWQSDGRGLSQFLVRPLDVIALRPLPAALSVEAIAREVGVHPDCARAMIRQGTFVRGDGRPAINDIERFKRDFVVGSKLARELGRSPRGLHRRLAQSGIEPAFDVRTHRQVVYRRSDLLSLGTL